HSLSLWTTYKPTNKLTLGLGAYAQSSVVAGYTVSTNTAHPGVVSKGASGYARYDAMASYQFNPNLALQVNVYNLTDKVYYSGVRSTHYATMAPGRSAVATLKFTY
ncbi:MAG TPA: TonB-dependent receptor, partial [Comamonas sp.]